MKLSARHSDCVSWGLIKKIVLGPLERICERTSPAVQGLGLHAFKAQGADLIPGWGIEIPRTVGWAHVSQPLSPEQRACMLERKILRAATKTRHSQINKQILKNCLYISLKVTASFGSFPPFYALLCSNISCDCGQVLIQPFTVYSICFMYVFITCSIFMTSTWEAKTETRNLSLRKGEWFA